MIHRALFCHFTSSPQTINLTWWLMAQQTDKRSLVCCTISSLALAQCNGQFVWEIGMSRTYYSWTDAYESFYVCSIYVQKYIYRSICSIDVCFDHREALLSLVLMVQRLAWHGSLMYKCNIKTNVSASQVRTKVTYLVWKTNHWRPSSFVSQAKSHAFVPDLALWARSVSRSRFPASAQSPGASRSRTSSSSLDRRSRV